MHAKATHFLKSYRLQLRMDYGGIKERQWSHLDGTHQLLQNLPAKWIVHKHQKKFSY